MAKSENITNEEFAKEVESELKELINKGNVSRIIIKKDDETIVNIPLNAGVTGTILGLTTAPWMIILAAIGTIGFDCKVEVIKADGEVVKLR